METGQGPWNCPGLSCFAPDVRLRLDGVTEPPAGRERLFAVWTSRPLVLRLEELQAVAEKGAIPASGQYQATRNMVKVKKAVEGLTKEEGQVVVLEVDHGS